MPLASSLGVALPLPCWSPVTLVATWGASRGSKYMVVRLSATEASLDDIAIASAEGAAQASAPVLLNSSMGSGLGMAALVGRRPVLK